MTDDLNLSELDRLDREATVAKWHLEQQWHWVVGPNGETIARMRRLDKRPVNATFTITVRNQLRPLLDLVEKMGEALGHMRYCATQWHPRTNDECVVDEWLDEAATALDAYREAKEGTSQ